MSDIQAVDRVLNYACTDHYVCVFNTYIYIYNAYSGLIAASKILS